MIFVLGKTVSRERKLLNFKKSSKTFTNDTKAISDYIYLLQHSVMSLSNPLIPTSWQQEEPLGCSVFAEPDYSNPTSTLPLTLQLCYKPLGILQSIINNK